MKNKKIRITRKQLRRLVEQVAEAGSGLTDVKEKEIDKKLSDYLADEGGAAGEEGTENIVINSVDGMSKDGAKNYLKSKERFVQLKSGDYIDNEQLSEIIRESLEKIDFYKKYSYGLDDVPNKTKAHDDIIGHT
jgi:hypothetical protein